MSRTSAPMQRMPSATRSSQRGVVLLIALIVLVAMTLAGLGIIRSLDTGTLVAGNIGFRQAALASTDAGAEAAMRWLEANASGTNFDLPASGYYATRMDSLDVTGNRSTSTIDGVDWDGTNSAIPVKPVHVGLDAAGNDIFYIINRLCTSAGDPSEVATGGQDCTQTTGSGLSSSHGVPDASKIGFPNQPNPYYRITVRANGPKNSVSYTQAYVVLKPAGT